MKPQTLVLAVGLAVNGIAAGDDGYLIRNVSVVDVERSALVKDRDVAVVGDRIERIAPAGEIDPSGLTVIDGSRLYLMPGLFDAHVHLTPSVDTFGPMLVANGITCVRDTGAPTGVILELRRQAEAGEVLLPRIVCTGAIIDGNPPVWPFSEACDEPAEARAAVGKLAEAGVDQIKVYSLLKKDVYLAAVEETHARGLKATGHVPVDVDFDEALAAGQDCVEHLTGMDKVIGKLAGWQPAPETGPWGWFGAWEAFPAAPREGLEAFAARVAASGMHHCPTLVVMKSIGRAADPDEADGDPRMAYVPASLKSFWRGASGMADRSARVVPHMQAMVAELHKAGVPLMIGTDLANAYVFAGFAVHEEMQLFQDAGVPAADVLKAATIVPARFCGVDDALGTVEEGKTASLVLVRDDPLRDIGNASKVEAVFLGGRYFDRAALDDRLTEVKSFVADQARPEPVVVDMSVPGEVIHEGRFVFTFGGMDAGIEDFVISKVGDGYHLKAYSRPEGGPQTPFVVTAHLGEDFEYRWVKWREVGGAGREATYTFDNGSIKAVASRDGAELGAQELEMPADGMFSTPASVTELVSIKGADLDVGESGTYSLVSFGFPTWKMTVGEYTLARGEDTTLSVNGGQVPARAYTWIMPTDWGEFIGEMWSDEWGLLLKQVVRMPFGELTVRQDGVE